jgi:hypothetical protein
MATHFARPNAIDHSPSLRKIAKIERKAKPWLSLFYFKTIQIG